MRIPLSRKSVLWLAGGAVLCGGVVVGVRFFPVGRFADDSEWTALTAERDALRQPPQRPATALAGQPWTPELLNAIRRDLGSAWRWSGPEPAGADAAQTVVTEASLRDWPKLLGGLRRLDGHRGIGVDHVEVVASGAGARRRFERVVVTLRPAGSTGPPAAGTPP